MIPDEIERSQIRYKIEYVASYAGAGIQLIEVGEDLMETIFKTIKTVYPFDLSLVPS